MHACKYKSKHIITILIKVHYGIKETSSIKTVDIEGLTYLSLFNIEIY